MTQRNVSVSGYANKQINHEVQLALQRTLAGVMIWPGQARSGKKDVFYYKILKQPGWQTRQIIFTLSCCLGVRIISGDAEYVCLPPPSPAAKELYQTLQLMPEKWKWNRERMISSSSGRALLLRGQGV